MATKEVGIYSPGPCPLSGPLIAHSSLTRPTFIRRRDFFPPPEKSISKCDHEQKKTKGKTGFLAGLKKKIFSFSTKISKFDICIVDIFFCALSLSLCVFLSLYKDMTKLKLKELANIKVAAY